MKRFCACGHRSQLHDEDGAGRCTVTLPPFEDEELPAWSCPCRRFAAAAPAMYRWSVELERWVA